VQGPEDGLAKNGDEVADEAADSVGAHALAGRIYTKEHFVVCTADGSIMHFTVEGRYALRCISGISGIA
jgi:hypothetical protein